MVTANAVVRTREDTQFINNYALNDGGACFVLWLLKLLSLLRKVGGAKPYVCVLLLCVLL